VVDETVTLGERRKWRPGGGGGRDRHYGLTGEVEEVAVVEAVSATVRRRDRRGCGRWGVLSDDGDVSEAAEVEVVPEDEA